MKKKTFVLLISILSVYSCDSLGSYTYVPYDNIKVSFNFKKFTPPGKYGSKSLSFDLLIINEAEKPYFFHPSKLRALVNGKMSQETHYDSFASAIPQEERIKKGKNIYSLYFVISNTAKSDDIEEFEIVNFGIYPK